MAFTLSISSSATRLYFFFHLWYVDLFALQHFSQSKELSYHTVAHRVFCALRNTYRNPISCRACNNHRMECRAIQMPLQCRQRDRFFVGNIFVSFSDNADFVLFS